MGWTDRAALLAPQLVELQPDVIGLQELRHFYPRQARWLKNRAAALDKSLTYDVHPTYKSGIWWFWEGIATLTQLPIVDRSHLRLKGQYRVGNVTRVRLPDGELLDFYNVHLASGFANEGIRTEQARQLLDWMDGRTGVAQVLVGDFNSRPSAPTIGLVSERLRSAYHAVHGAEPERPYRRPSAAVPGQASSSTTSSSTTASRCTTRGSPSIGLTTSSPTSSPPITTGWRQPSLFAPERDRRRGRATFSGQEGASVEPDWAS